MFKFDEKEIFKMFILILISVLSVITLTGCSYNEMEVLKEKVDKEMRYMEIEFLGMINMLNNITFKNYTVIVDETKNNNKESTNSTSESNGESSSDSSLQGSEITNKRQDKITTSQTKSDAILETNRTTDWTSLKTKIELMYSTWSTIIIDLYKLNLSSDEITSFSNDLDKLTKAIKDENKIDSAKELANIYAYIPKYLEKYSTKTDLINIIKTKSNIIKAYALLEEDKWQELEIEIKNAENTYMAILNNISEKDRNNQTNINKGYILIKEIQESIKNKDKEIFYIKYRNAMEQLGMLMA